MHSLLLKFSALILILLGGATTLAASAVSADDIGRRFAGAVDRADARAFNELLDIDAIAARVLNELSADAPERDHYLDQLRSSYAALGRSLAAQYSAGKASARLVSVGPDGPLVRVTMKGADGGLGHSYMRLKLSADGRIEDWYDYALAMFMSDQLRFSAASLIPPGDLVLMLFGSVEDARTAAKFKQFASHLIVGDQAQAFKVLQTMPPEVKKTRAYATLAVVLSRQLGIDALTQTLAALVESHGEVDDLQFILIDHYQLTGQFDKMLAAVAIVERQIGTDEVVLTNRCSALIGLERYDDALAACDQALDIDPSFDTALWTRVRLGLTKKDAELAVASLQRIEKATGELMDLSKLSRREAYAWLREQAPFKALLASRGIAK